MPAVIKRARVVISLLVLAIFVFIFVDSWSNLSVQISGYFTDLQLVPSMLRTFISHTIVLGGFIIILASTLVFGRLYCSFLCPLGVIQDLIIYSHKIITPKKRRKSLRLPALGFLRYSVLAAVVISMLAGSAVLLIWLDPYSISGRIFTSLLKPLVGIAFNAGVQGLNSIDYYNLLPVDWIFRAHPAFWAISFWLIMILLLSVKYGRLYCNSLCPVGSFLGLLSKISVYRIKIDNSGCGLCGSCVKVCKAGCINLKNKSVDFSRCVGCMNCIDSCDQASINFTRQRKETKSTGKSRRNWLGKSMNFLAVVPLTALKDTLTGHSIVIKEEDKPRRITVTPPGSLGRYHLLNHCTACHLCISHCPTQVLQPIWLENSINGMFQPTMDFSVKYCLYECNICTLVCPTGAILPLNIVEKKRVQPGKSRFIEHLCVVVTKGTLCGACSEHCPTKACDMVPYKDNLGIPKIDNDVCVGCGACEHACPTQPKSIIVDENIIHLTALLPRKKVIKPLINKGKEVIEEFPF